MKKHDNVRSVRLTTEQLAQIKLMSEQLNTTLGGVLQDIVFLMLPIYAVYAASSWEKRQQMLAELRQMVIKK